MDLAEARSHLAEAAWYPAKPSGRGIPAEPLEVQLKELRTLADAGKLPAQGAAIWYALTQGLRDLADSFEADLFRQLHDRDGYTWEAIAELVEATRLGSRQAVQRRAQRLTDMPARRRREARSAGALPPP